MVQVAGCIPNCCKTSGGAKCGEDCTARCGVVGTDVLLVLLFFFLLPILVIQVLDKTVLQSQTVFKQQDIHCISIWHAWLRAYATQS